MPRPTTTTTTTASGDAVAAVTEWTPTDPAWTPEREHTLGELALLDELLHPVRGALVRRMKDPRTVAEVAGELGVPVTRLYHHVKRLEADGLIRVQATRRVGAVTERRYQTIARSFDVDKSLMERAEGAELGRAVGGMFDVAKSALQREFELGSLVGQAPVEHLMLHSLVTLELTAERRVELLQRLRGLIDEFGSDDGDAGATPFRVFVSAFPETP